MNAVESTSLDVNESLLRTWRAEQGRIRATLIRAFHGDFDAADDALSASAQKALTSWPTSGIPQNPAAWLVTTAKNHAIDLARRRQRFSEKEAAIETLASMTHEAQRPHAPDDVTKEQLVRGRFRDDDRLRLLFTCCHPALAKDAQVALTLQTLSGLTTDDIARAFLVDTATMAQRLVRAKRKIKDAGIPYHVPDDDVLDERVDAVLHVLYLVFNEGYASSSGASLVRQELATDALSLMRLLISLMPYAVEAKGLLALALAQHARAKARTDDDGRLLTLDDQDRSLWNRALIDEANRVFHDAMVQKRAGPYQVQAAIALVHVNAPRAADTNWAQILVLYDALSELLPTPIVALNRAVAVAFAVSLDEGLRAMRALDDDGALATYHLLPAAMADLHRRRGDKENARIHYDRAIALVENEVERAYLERRSRELAD